MAPYPSNTNIMARSSKNDLTNVIARREVEAIHECNWITTPPKAARDDGWRGDWMTRAGGDWMTR